MHIPKYAERAMVAERTSDSENGNLIFVSYAHENNGWIEALELHKDL